MAATRRRRVVSPGGPSSSSPAQQDEADILEEVGAVRDEDTGDLMVDQERILEVGAVDAESVRDNRRTADIVNKNRGGVNAGFNIDDMLAKYEGIIKSWPPNTLDVSMKSLTGSQATYVIKSHPRSGVELYDAIMERHGQQGEAKYEIAVFDSSGKVWRGKGQITMPDTRPATAPQQGQQPMMYPPPGYQPPQYAHPPTVQPAQAPVPSVHVASSQAALDPSSMMTMMQQMIGMIDQMRSAAQPAPAPAPPVWQPPPSPQMPAPLSPGATPAEMMTWMQQMVGMVDQMRSTAQQPVASPPPSPPQYQAPPPPPPPPPSPQSGIFETMTMMEQMFKMFQRMQGPSSGAAPPTQGPFRGPRPAYGGDQDRAPQPQYQPPAPPPREKSPQDLMRDAMGTIRMVTTAAQEMQSLFPGQEPQYAQPATEMDEDAPVRIVDTGAGKLVMDAKDGTLRKMETFMTAAPGIMKWIGEQTDAFRKAQEQRQTKQQPQQLPDGFVEVREGYKPPPGWVAVPVDRLPEPPEQVPPPITEPEQAWSWGAPPIPGQGD